MDQNLAYLVAADLVLLVHALFVAFVVVGLVLILAGKPLGWSWVRNPWFRAAHLAAIAVVVLQAWLGIVCPLTTWEMALRAKGGDAVYAGAFVAHWLDALLYYQAPPWVFAVAYTLFGALVVLSWFRVRPRPFGRSETSAAARNVAR
jgi:hypothetical protein